MGAVGDWSDLNQELGSVAQKVLAQSPVPVMILKA